MPGPRRAVPRVSTRAFVVHHAEGGVTRVMQSQKRVGPRVTLLTKVAIDGADLDDATPTVGELEEIANALRDLASSFDYLSRERATRSTR